VSRLYRESSRRAAPPAGPARGLTAGAIGREIVRVGVILSAIALVLGLLAVAMGSV
jgi:hypothetical protein